MFQRPRKFKKTRESVLYKKKPTENNVLNYASARLVEYLIASRD